MISHSTHCFPCEICELKYLKRIVANLELKILGPDENNQNQAKNDALANNNSMSSNESISTVKEENFEFGQNNDLSTIPELPDESAGVTKETSVLLNDPLHTNDYQADVKLLQEDTGTYRYEFVTTNESSIVPDCNPQSNDKEVDEQYLYKETAQNMASEISPSNVTLNQTLQNDELGDVVVNHERLNENTLVSSLIVQNSNTVKENVPLQTSSSVQVTGSEEKESHYFTQQNENNPLEDQDYDENVNCTDEAMSVQKSIIMKNVNPNQLEEKMLDNNKINQDEVSERFALEKYSSAAQPYQCKICDFEGTTKMGLGVHISKVHAVYKLSKECPNDSKISMSVECEQCNYRSNSSKHLKIHKTLAHDKAKVNDKSINKMPHKKTNENDKTIKEGKLFYCELCSKAFNSSKLCRTHVKAVHLKMKPYKCEKCDFKFACRQARERHLRAVHLKIRPYECQKCDFKSARNYHLQRHIKTIHEKLTK